ncbi:MAG: hydrogenase maturation protease [Nitrospirae bacterium YQR-1]
MKTIVIGLGNPLLRDDSVGPKAARLIRQRLEGDMLCHRADVRVSEVYAGGIRLLDAMAGFDRAFIIDSIITGKPPGTVYKLTPQSLPQTRNCGCSHDMTLPMALGMGKMLGMELPTDIQIWAIEAKDINCFGEELSLEVERSLPMVINDVMDVLK